MLNILKEGKGWVELFYPDGTTRLFQTTLNIDILKKEAQQEIITFDDGLYDLERHEIVSLDGKIRIHKDKPKLGDIDAFINKFI
ncbi:hypothetical protein UT300012_23070 [Paraclostridium bifermentans]